MIIKQQAQSMQKRHPFRRTQSLNSLTPSSGQYKWSNVGIVNDGMGGDFEHSPIVRFQNINQSRTEKIRQYSSVLY